jgi:hypothetical protein
MGGKEVEVCDPRYTKLRVYSGVVDQSFIFSGLTTTPECLLEKFTVSLRRICHTVHFHEDSPYRIKCTIDVGVMAQGPFSKSDVSPPGFGKSGVSRINCVSGNQGCFMDPRKDPENHLSNLNTLVSSLFRRISKIKPQKEKENDSELHSANTHPSMVYRSLSKPLRLRLEVCRLHNFRDLYIVDVKRLRGPLAEYRLVYQSLSHAISKEDPHSFASGN